MQHCHRPMTWIGSLALCALLAWGCDSPTQQTAPPAGAGSKGAAPAADMSKADATDQGESKPAAVPPASTPADPTAASSTPAPAASTPATPVASSPKASTPSGSTPAPKETDVSTPATPPSNPQTSTSPAAPPASTPAAPSAALKNPALAKEKAPETFKAKFTTTKGDFTITVTRAWSPNGADRFYNLVKIGYFQDIAFFRNIKGFMVQFGISGDPALNAAWRTAQIQDDPRAPTTPSNQRGYVSFAKTGFPNSRTTQIFINFGNNGPSLDGMGFTPFGQVTEGMDVVDSLFNGYGEGQPRGRGPDQGRVQMEGNAYLKSEYPNLDYVMHAVIEP